MLKVFLIAFVAVAIAQDSDPLFQDVGGEDYGFDLSANIGDVDFDTWAAFSGLDVESAPSDLLAEYQHTFDVNAELIKNFNAEPGHTFTLGFNKYTHLSPEQFAMYRLGFEMTPQLRSLPAAPAAPVFNSYTKANVPATRNWQSKMQPVLDQGYCGSCWAFATMGLLGEIK